MQNRIAITIALLIALAAPAATTFAYRQDDKPPAQQKEASKAQTSKKPDDQVRLESKLVSITLTVSDSYGRFVTGLRKENFHVYDNKVQQEIAHFTDDDAPLTLGIVYDVSGSMGDLTNRSFQALKRFFEISHEEDEYFIVAFNDKPRLVQDFTTSPSEIMSRVIFVKAKGNTALYDATYIAIEKAKQGRHPKKALLIISDGEENNSRYSGKELRRLLQESGVQIYSIGISNLMLGAGTLKQLSGETGGRAFFPYSDSEYGDIYTRIAIMLRHQYVIGFYPSDTTSQAKWHDVRISLTAPKGLGRLSMNYKKGYPSFQQ
jgi:Ca-activated chloride channel family protein